MQQRPRCIGILTAEVISLLGLRYSPGSPILIGDTNIGHMAKKHKEDYDRYGSYISEILANPDYVGLNPKDQSIEYVKEFKIESEYVKIAVRASGQGVFFARSIYALNNNRARNFISKGTLKPLTKLPE